MMYWKNAIRDSELLGVVDEKGRLVTKTDSTVMTVCRAAAHRYGIIHYTANVLLTDPDLSPAKDIQVLLQRRSKTKDIFPDAGSPGESLLMPLILVLDGVLRAVLSLSVTSGSL